MTCPNKKKKKKSHHATFYYTTSKWASAYVGVSSRREGERGQRSPARGGSGAGTTVRDRGFVVIHGRVTQPRGGCDESLSLLKLEG